MSEYRVDLKDVLKSAVVEALEERSDLVKNIVKEAMCEVAGSNGEQPEAERKELQKFVSDALDRYSTYRDHKEAMAYAGLALFTAAAATALASKDWPPAFAEHQPWWIVLAFTVLWGLVLLYLRYQLRRRRWAAIRVAGCDWLLAEWLPNSPKAISHDKDHALEPPGSFLRFIDYFLPMRHSVTALDRDKDVYPLEIQRAWLHAERVGTDALKHEYLISAAGWVAYGAVLWRTFL